MVAICRFEGKMKMPLLEVQEQGKTKTLARVSGLFAHFPAKTRKNGESAFFSPAAGFGVALGFTVRVRP